MDDLMGHVELLPILPAWEDNAAFLSQLESSEILDMTIKFYARIGYSFPWIGYFASVDGQLVGSGAFKGRPLYGKVEIAYGTFPMFRAKGIGTQICQALTAIARSTDPGIIITARTLREESYSTRILRHNGFVKKGTVVDPEDGKVWEWEYAGMVTRPSR